MTSPETGCDAWYVPLAESLGVDLVPADAALASAPGPNCRIVLVRADS